jgi:death-on-curing protein
VFLVLNGQEMEASVDEQERLMMELAAGNLRREDIVEWLSAHVVGC